MEEESGAGLPVLSFHFEQLESAERYSILYRRHNLRDRQRRADAIARFAALLDQGQTALDCPR